MNAEQFVYWLRGFLDAAKNNYSFDNGLLSSDTEKIIEVLDEVKI